MTEKPIGMTPENSSDKFVKDICASMSEATEIVDSGAAIMLDKVPRDKPIGMTPGNIVAIEEDRKTMFRVLIKNPSSLNGLMLEGEENEWCTYPEGTHLYIKEAHSDNHSMHYADSGPVAGILYKSDEGRLHRGTPVLKRVGGKWLDYYDRPVKWKHAWYMRKSFARTWLEVTKVYAPGKGKDATIKDIVAEGVLLPQFHYRNTPEGTRSASYKVEWHKFLTSIYGPDALTEWYWPIEFKKIERPS